MKEQSKKRTFRKATDDDAKYISLHNETRFAKQGNEDTPRSMDVMAVPNPNPYVMKKSGLNIMTIPTEDEFLPDAKAIDITPADVHRLNENIRKAVKKKSFGGENDEISNILEQIGDVQAELICRHQFGNSVRPALENISEEDLCERGIRLFYMLRNKYQGKDAVLREGNK